MKYYLIAGEASGDLHGSNLIKEIKKEDPDADIRCWGGDLMSEAGATLVKHYRDLAFMGFVEVIKNLPTILRNIRFCKQDIEAWQPDVLVLIDYPGFNLRIAEWAHAKRFKVVYYISPQVWAWKENRVKKMKQCIDKMLCILPFEKDYYKNKWNWDVEYVGHPLVEVVGKKLTDGSKQLTEDKTASQTSKIIALLPGSRKQEIAKKLPIMLSVAAHFPAYTFVVAKAPGLEDDFYTPFLNTSNNITSVRNQTYDLLLKSTAALVTSGTATLETALFGVPEVVCYKGNNLSYQIAKRLINIKYISLVNLIMDKEVVKELIQDELTKDNLVKELRLILDNDDHRKKIIDDYRSLKNILSEGGNASVQSARHIIKVASQIN
ncbi:lipid-A-disaccharide synthase [Sediminibacterium sp. KACHI17]|jgi:lipid-A-disaccharide synthase|uniref:Lipid-A-disaccharide synthase n=1 Tax=Sediminibacterium sp. KACHI17 TaxID=1751071 RepID=A0AAT9GMK8_9BACT